MRNTIKHTGNDENGKDEAYDINLHGVVNLVRREVESRFNRTVNPEDLAKWLSPTIEWLGGRVNIDALADAYVADKDNNPSNNASLYLLADAVKAKIESISKREVNTIDLASWLAGVCNSESRSTSVNDLAREYISIPFRASGCAEYNQMKRDTDEALQRLERKNSLHPDDGSDFKASLKDVAKRSSRLSEARKIDGVDYCDNERERYEMLDQLVRKPIRSFVQLDYFNYETGAAGYNGDGFDVFMPTPTREFSNSYCLRLLIPEDYTREDVLKALDEFKDIVSKIKPVTFGSQVKAEIDAFMKSADRRKHSGGDGEDHSLNDWSLTDCPF